MIQLQSFNHETKELLFDVLYANLYAGFNLFIPVTRSRQLSQLLETGFLEEKIDKRILLFGYTRNELNKRIEKYGLDFKKNMKISLLINWCLENIPDKIEEMCSDGTTVVLSKDLELIKTRIYNYLRKQLVD